jgi:uncharacterized membrane protein YedE/YeeE
VARLVSLACGIAFGAGLALSDMTNPAKVQNFLDFFGSFDPSLACVMGSAVAVSAAASAAARRRAAPWLAGAFALPTRRDIDAPLVGGAALFGVGWGLAGLCPGPALAGLVSGQGGVALFAASMLAGIWLQRRWAARSREAACC